MNRESRCVSVLAKRNHALWQASVVSVESIERGKRASASVPRGIR